MLCLNMDIPYPERFSFEAQKWPSWKRFQRFRAASDLASKPQERQIAMLIYCMGDKAEDIFSSYQPPNDDAKVYDTVLQRFDDHFVIQKNIIFKRATFNKRVQEQEEGETAETFITALHKLAETCDYGTLREQLIRDRIVVGIKDNKLSERPQLGKQLTLDKATTMVRQAEHVHGQQATIHGTTSATATLVNAIQGPTQSSHENQWRKGATSGKCGWCGHTTTSRTSSVPSTRHHLQEVWQICTLRQSMPLCCQICSRHR
jgi:hypothetical protein